MALTPRQKQFYHCLVALWRATGHSVHYSAVARALHVSPFSAYDMLKTLSSKGVVAAEYVLEGESSNPGRSAIRFYPVSEALYRPALDDAEWAHVRRHQLACLREVRDNNAPEVLGDVLSRLSDSAAPLSYCCGVVTALLVNLRALGQETFAHRLLPALRVLVSTGEVGLGALAGLSIGSSIGACFEAPALDPLMRSVRRFQVYLNGLGTESRQRLAEFLADALVIIETTQP